jgi:hypothetical protein
MIEEQHGKTTTKVSGTVKMVGGIAAALIGVATVVWLGHHIK